MSQFFIGAGGGGPGGIIETINHIGPDVTDNFTLESTSGTITFTPIANGLDLNVVFAGIPWNDINGSQILAPNEGYFITGSGTYQLPFPAQQGQTIEIVVDTSSMITLSVLSGQTIRSASSVTSINGTAVNSKRGDTLEVVFRAATSTWWAKGNTSGNWEMS